MALNVTDPEGPSPNLNAYCVVYGEEHHVEVMRVLNKSKQIPLFHISKRFEELGKSCGSRGKHYHLSTWSSLPIHSTTLMRNVKKVDPHFADHRGEKVRSLTSILTCTTTPPRYTVISHLDNHLEKFIASIPTPVRTRMEKYIAERDVGGQIYSPKFKLLV